MDTGVKHSGREVYHWCPPSVKVMNEWSCISAFPMSSWCGQELFLIFHMRATFRAHHVMRLLCSVKLPCKFLPAATYRAPTFTRHTTLLSNPLCLLARPVMHLFIVIMADTSSSTTWQVSLSCILLYRIRTIVYMHATKACRSGRISPHY